MAHTKIRKAVPNKEKDPRERFTRWGDPVLTTPAIPVDLGDLKTPAFKALTKKMFKRIEGIGVGLAANQIGLPMKFAVLEIEANPKRPEATPLPKTVIVNPVITKTSEEKQYHWNGCLSCWGIRYYSEWPQWLEVKYVDGMTGEKVERKVEGFQAILFQHEIDHLNGRVCGERLITKNGKVVRGSISLEEWVVKNKGAKPVGLEDK